MRPLQQFVLVEEIEAKAEGTLILADQDIKRARVLKIGPEVNDGVIPTGYKEGSIVRFFKGNQIKLTNKNDKQCLIEHGNIIAVEDDFEEVESSIDKDKNLFLLPRWEEYIGSNDEYDQWKDYENVSLFSFVISFVMHTLSKESLIRVVYESCCRVLRNHDVLMNYIETTTNSDGSLLSVDVNDDVYDFSFRLGETYLEFRKSALTLQNLTIIMPAVSRIFSLILSTQEFKKVLGRDSNRVSMTSTKITQTITLTKKTLKPNEPVQNWDLMRALIKVETKDDRGQKTLFGLLGPESKSLGRTDFLIGFEKAISDHIYNIFLEVKAPSNNQNKLLSVEWSIQDYAPGIITDRDYSPLLTTFFRDIVLNSFYLNWFEQVTCTTKLR